jgi:peptidyl-prolyl cis-trans isomerase B (cyclophilin B)
MAVAVMGWTLLALPKVVWAQPAADPYQGLRAELITGDRRVQVGDPIPVYFLLTNTADSTVTVNIPQQGAMGTPEDLASPIAAGLPIGHVFSGRNFRALDISAENRTGLGDLIVHQPTGPVPAVTLPPMACAGLLLDVAEYYPVLRHSGVYTLIWRPYEGALASEPLVIEVTRLKNVVISTDYGRMVIELFYEQAPLTVANFLELVNEGFYNNLTFHRILRGTLIQGGCPLGNGRGIRPDGKTIPAEPNGIPVDAGSVAMALKGNDPNSASCQFFISAQRIPEFDGRYTVFGRLIGEESMQTLRAIAEVPTDNRGTPEQRIVMRSVTVQDVAAGQRETTEITHDRGQPPAG